MRKKHSFFFYVCAEGYIIHGGEKTNLGVQNGADGCGGIGLECCVFEQEGVAGGAMKGEQFEGDVEAAVEVEEGLLVAAEGLHGGGGGVGQVAPGEDHFECADSEHRA